ncbi:PREDICTED: zinc finger CCCH domain-containing protein 14 isoform X1 [Ceratosolen solmsi marchali]|uniref:Zinc finger CCCH domain-containing protein 14 n=1 Tax=Ceratosolen solmsi marchali TaxID=326594 RepID=A0AAJ7DU28_9HYME|nr:PREDICTED: zinc finger CCCH domain-containing protein 14 isoform X1 [Ceratosolen solmsi marchali]
MDIRGIEITNQLRSAIRAKLLELGVRYDEELPDYILVMVVNKKSRQQMNEDLHLFLEDSTEPFVNWLHDQVLKKLQKVTVKKKSNKEVGSSVVVKEEKDKKKIKVEDQSKSVLDKEVITKVDRDREFEELVGDLTLLNENDNKIGLKDIVHEDKSQKKKNPLHSTTNYGNIANNVEKKDTVTSTVSASTKPLNNDKKVASFKYPRVDVSEKSNESSIQNLKHSLNPDDISNEKNTQATKRLKLSDDLNNKDENKLKSSINKPKITSVISIKTRLGVIPPAKKSDLDTKPSSDIRSALNKNHLHVGRNETSSQRSSVSQNKIVERRKQRNEDARTEQSKTNKNQFSSNLKTGKSNKIGDLKNKERLSNKWGTVKSRLGIHKQDEPLLKSCNSIKVSKPRISNVKSRLGVRKRQQNSALSDAVFRPSQKPQNDKNFPEEDDDSVINTSLKSHVIDVKKHQMQKQKQKNIELKKQSDSNVDAKKEELEKIDDEDACKVSSKIIVTPRPLKPLQPSLKRATQSLLLRAVAEANQSVVMQKKLDPCLKEQKFVNKIKVMRDPWQGKILSVNLNSKKRLVMEKIQIELTNPDIISSSKPHSSQVVTEEHLDMVKSLFKRSDDKQKFLVTLNGYNNNILKERNSDDEERIEMEVNEDDELALGNSQYRSHIENDRIIDEHDDDINKAHYINEDHDTNEDHELNDDTEIEYIEPKIESNGNDNAENLRLEENPCKRKRKLSPIVYTRSRSSTPEDKPTLASTVNSVLRIDKRPLISSVITTVADKSNEKCRYWPNCTLGIKCAYYHPEVMCR